MGDPAPRLARAQIRGDSAETETAIQGCPLVRLKTQLLDGRGEPARGHPFVINQSGSLLLGGDLDDSGSATVTGRDTPPLQIGSVKVFFPQGPEERPVLAPPDTVRSVRLQLLDQRGEPAKGWSFELDDGTNTHHGHLDEFGEGWVVVPKTVGRCTVRFRRD